MSTTAQPPLQPAPTSADSYPRPAIFPSIGDLNDPNKPRTITLYVNGDPYFAGKKIVVNRRYIRSWEALLTAMTNAVGDGTTCVRELATPVGGTRVDDLDKLRDHGEYVAVSKGEFVPLGLVVEIGRYF